MADNIAITAGAGTTVATDDIGGVHYQRLKTALGPNGTYTADQAGRDLGSGDGAAYVDNRPKLVSVQVASAGLTTASTAYTADDQLGTLLTFSGMARANGGSLLLQTALLVDRALVVVGCDLFLFDTSVTLAADNVAASISDADMDHCRGVFTFPLGNPTAANRMSAVTPGFAIKCDAADTALYGALVTRGAHTFFGAVSDLKVTLVAYQD